MKSESCVKKKGHDRFPGWARRYSKGKMTVKGRVLFVSGDLPEGFALFGSEIPKYYTKNLSALDFWRQDLGAIHDLTFEWDFTECEGNKGWAKYTIQSEQEVRQEKIECLSLGNTLVTIRD